MYELLKSNEGSNGASDSRLIIISGFFSGFKAPAGGCLHPCRGLIMRRLNAFELFTSQPWNNTKITFTQEKDRDFFNSFNRLITASSYFYLFNSFHRVYKQITIIYINLQFGV